MSETLRKIMLYLRPAVRYWQRTGDIPSRVPTELGPYPLDYVPRLAEGHFARTDAGGLPIRPRSGGMVHNYTRLAGYALAHWNLFLQSGSDHNLAPLVRVANYVVETAEWSDGTVRLRAELPGQGHIGPVSAMSQGQAISVLCRAFEATNDDSYRDLAIASVRLFDVEVDDGGIVGRITSNGLRWYEEDTAEPLRHILNGMVFALWGLRDAWRLLGSDAAGRYYEDGIESLSRSILAFDSGWWSWYDLPERGVPYIASMTYHDLHVCQLRWLAADSRSGELLAAARRFSRYEASPINRLRAAGRMSVAKILRHYRH